MKYKFQVDIFATCAIIFFVWTANLSAMIAGYFQDEWLPLFYNFRYYFPDDVAAGILA